MKRSYAYLMLLSIFIFVMLFFFEKTSIGEKILLLAVYGGSIFNIKGFILNENVRYGALELEAGEQEYTRLGIFIVSSIGLFSSFYGLVNGNVW